MQDTSGYIRIRILITNVPKLDNKCSRSPYARGACVAKGGVGGRTAVAMAQAALDAAMAAAKTGDLRRLLPHLIFTNGRHCTLNDHDAADALPGYPRPLGKRRGCSIEGASMASLASSRRTQRRCSSPSTACAPKRAKRRRSCWPVNSAGGSPHFCTIAAGAYQLRRLAGLRRRVH